MVKEGGHIQKYSTKITAIATSYNEDGNRQQSPLCSVPDCHDYSISRCTICSCYCCYNHVYGHDHSMDDFEILK